MNVAERPLLQSVGDSIAAPRSAWSFGGAVPETFEEHVRRSVPGYDTGHEIILQVSDFFVHDSSMCYEIGASKGKLISALAERHESRGSWIGLDIERSMVKFAGRRHKGSSAQFALADACQYNYQSCDLIIAYYTVQFVRPHQRQALINSLYGALNWGGALLMFEKVRTRMPASRTYAPASTTISSVATISRRTRSWPSRTVCAVCWNHSLLRPTSTC